MFLSCITRPWGGGVHIHQKQAFISPTSPRIDTIGSLRPWSSGTRHRCVWRTSATSWRTMLRTTSALTLPTAPTRSISSVPCRICREWGPCTSSPPRAGPTCPTTSQSQSDRVSLLQEQQRGLPRSAEGDRDAACMWGPAHDLLPDSPHAEGDQAAAPDRREYPGGVETYPEALTAVLPLTSFLTLISL